MCPPTNGAGHKVNPGGLHLDIKPVAVGHQQPCGTMQSHHDYSMAMVISETPCPVISVPWGESGPGGSCHADGDSEHVHHLHSVLHLAGVARQPCTTWVGGHLAPDPSCTPCMAVVPRSPPLTRPPRSPHLAPRCLQSPEGRRAGHTGREARCSAWAPSAPWAAVGRAGLSLDAHIHQLLGPQPRPMWWGGIPSHGWMSSRAQWPPPP